MSIEENKNKIPETLDDIKDIGLETVTQLQKVQKAIQNIVIPDNLKNVETIIGKKGDKGDKGDKGETGKEGKQGLQGKQGDKGEDGKDGIDGKKGEQGAKGDKGDKGNNGKDGIDGQDGENGNDGSPDTGIDIITKINELPIDAYSPKIDAIHIKNLPLTIDAYVKKQGGGSGSGGGTWGSITGTLSSQTDLQNALNAKWGILGNSGLVDGTNFLGTTDNIPLSFKVNNVWSGLISSDSNKGTIFGYLAGNLYNAGNNANANTAFGYSALASVLTGGNANVAIGNNALYFNTTGTRNNAMGNKALYTNTIGTDNVANGQVSMELNVDGSFNTAMGRQSLRNGTSVNYNVAIGYASLYNNLVGGYNTVLGTQAGYNLTGSSNVLIGYKTGYTNATAVSNQLWLDNGDNAIPLIYGDFTTRRIGLGTKTPDTILHIVGQLKQVDGSQGVGKILTSDANGVATWQNPGASNLSAKDACDVATVAALPANTYNNGTLGVGATLTGNANGALPAQDTTYSPLVGDRILVKDEVTQSHNGNYDVTVLGDGSNPYVLTRSTDYDTSAEVDAGTYTNIVNGTVNANTIWQQTTVSPTLGASNLVFAQVTSLNSKLDGVTRTFDGQGGTLGTGNYVEIEIPYAGTITSWSIHSITPGTGADLSGSIVVDIKRSGTSIIGSGNKPTLSSSASASAAANASWTSKTIVANDVLAFYISSVTTCQKVRVSLRITRT